MKELMLSRMRLWCTAHKAITAFAVASSTLIYLALLVINPNTAQQVAVGYLVLIVTLLVMIEWGIIAERRGDHRGK